jgi:hypothetical protein
MSAAFIGALCTIYSKGITMPSETDVANLALAHAGARSTIASMTEASTEASICTRFFEAARDETLSAAWWTFARATVVLTLLKSAPGTPEFQGVVSNIWNAAYPAPPWLYEYAYPADCLKARYIIPIDVSLQLTIPIFSVPLEQGVLVNGAAVRFVTAQDLDDTGNQIKVVLTNQPQAVLVYTRQTTDPTLWGPSFVMALSLVLGAYITPTISGDKKLQANLFAAARQKILESTVDDANEGLPIQESMPDWMTIRGAGNFAGELSNGPFGGSYVS